MRLIGESARAGVIVRAQALKYMDLKRKYRDEYLFQVQHVSQQRSILLLMK